MDNKAKFPNFFRENILTKLRTPSSKPLDADLIAKLDASLERSRSKWFPDRRAYVYSDVLGRLDDAEVVELVAEGINRPDKKGHMLLSAVAETNRVGLCEALLAKGANPDISSMGGDAMEDCVYAGGKAAVSMLDRMLKHSRYGIREQHRSGMTLLHLAVSLYNWEAIKYLVGKGAELSDMDIDCETVEEYARQKGGEAYVTELRSLAGNARRRKSRGQTP